MSPEALLLGIAGPLWCLLIFLAAAPGASRRMRVLAALAIVLLASALGFTGSRAGALSLAAALSGKAGRGPIVAIVSGGNIDLKAFCELIGS